MSDALLLALAQPLHIARLAPERQARPWSAPAGAWRLQMANGDILHQPTVRPVRDAARYLLEGGESPLTHFSLSTRDGTILFSGEVGTAAEGVF